LPSSALPEVSQDNPIVNFLFLAVTFPLVLGLQPIHAAIYEGSSLYMPTALPGISITQGFALLQEQDRVLRSLPEVETVIRVVGRSDSATDTLRWICMTHHDHAVNPANNGLRHDLGN